MFNNKSTVKKQIHQINVMNVYMLNKNRKQFPWPVV